MKIKITEIEATSEDLKQSKTLSDAFTNLLRTSFIPQVAFDFAEDEKEEDTDD